jgi:hypothetical protein
MGTSLLQTEDKGYLITGTICLGGDYDYAISLIKTDSSGEVQWQKHWRPAEHRCRSGETIQTEDKGFITIGRASYSDTEESSIYIVKCDVSGDTLWTKIYKKGFSSHSFSVKQSTDGGHIIAATAAKKFRINIIGRKMPDASDAWIFKLDPNGEMEWEQLFGGPFNDTVHHLHENSDGSFVFTGRYGMDVGNYRIWLVKLSADGDLIVNKNISNPVEFTLSHNYPNPFNPSTTIKYTLPHHAHVKINIVDLLGRTVRRLVSGEKAAGTHVISWNGKDQKGTPVPSGVYLYSMTSEGFRMTRKLSLLR